MTEPLNVPPGMVPIGLPELARFAKGGCARCGGAGYVDQRAKVTGDDGKWVPPTKANACKCVQNRLASRTDTAIVANVWYWVREGAKPPEPERPNVVRIGISARELGEMAAKDCRLCQGAGFLKRLGMICRCVQPVLKAARDRGEACIDPKLGWMWLRDAELASISCSVVGCAHRHGSDVAVEAPAV